MEYLWDFPGKNTKVGCHALLQGIFQIQGWNPSPLHLLHWQGGSLPLAQPGVPYWIHSKSTDWFAHEKEWNSDPGYHMNPENTMQCARSQPQEAAF